MVADLKSMLEPSQCKRLVIKIGSALLVEQGKPARGWLDALALDLRDLRAKGGEVIIVSSGAIALGAARLGLPRGGPVSYTHLTLPTTPYV